MKKIAGFIILFVLIAGAVSAQYLSYDIIKTMDFYRLNNTTIESPKNTLTEASIEGSPYLNDEFINGTVYTTDKKKVVDIPLRYNIYNDNLEFKMPTGEIMEIAKPESVERAEFGKIKMIYHLSDSKEAGFFKLISEGKVSLLAKPDIFFQKATKEAAYKEAQPPRFIQKPEIPYLKNNENVVVKIKGKKDLINEFSDHKNEVEAFIKKNKIKASNQDDLIKVVEFYNSL